MLKCVICSDNIGVEANGWKGGSNAEPVAKGRCCKPCDNSIVIPTRIKMYLARNKKGE